ncbi:MAG: 4-hydroxyphenylpyruvate dioxygenase [Halieaceae bacterium]|jgi:4-hydroxyphenylpyruvate dioxygenase
MRTTTSVTLENAMADLLENPMGLDGFEFVEFASLQRGVLEPAFEMMGFSLVASHKTKDVDLWRQGTINFIINYEPGSPAFYYAEEHGPSACGMAFRVKDAASAYQRALDLGAQPIDIPCGPMELKMPAIRGIGGAILYLIDRYEDGSAIYDIDFVYRDDVERYPQGCGFNVIDHLTHNVYRGRMEYWAGFYERLFNFREIRFFDITGEYTGLKSRAMSAPDGKIRIPLNEEGRAGGAGQIEEFLMKYNGEGIQHIAFSCDDLLACWDRLKERGIPFMTAPPETYYDMLEQRLPGHGEPVDELKARGILLDGNTEGEPRLLLQIFSETLVGPIFFEFIQRKEDEGFGEGNFQALFESMERDQIRRGALGTDGSSEPVVDGGA